MAYGPITPWKIEGKKVKVVPDFLFLGSKITADGDCSHEIRKHCFLAGKLYKTRQCVEKQRHYSADKGPYNQGYGLPSGRESWTIKKEGRRRINAFELRCWRRLLRVPWT